MEYDERLYAPLRWWVQGTMLVASAWLATVVAMPAGGALLVTAICAALLVAFLTGYGGVRLQVGAGRLRAGQASIATELLAAVTPLDAVATRRQAGVDADARAYLVLRPYVKTAVRVDLADPEDPTPYWLLSTRHPEALAAALRGAAGRLADRRNIGEE